MLIHLLFEFFYQIHNLLSLFFIKDNQESVRRILEKIGLGKYADRFEEGDCQYDDFLNLNDDDFTKLGIPHFPQKRIKNQIKKLWNTTLSGNF